MDLNDGHWWALSVSTSEKAKASIWSLRKTLADAVGYFNSRKCRRDSQLPLRYTLNYSSQTWSHAIHTICFDWIACSSCLCPKLLSTYIFQRCAVLTLSFSLKFWTIFSLLLLVSFLPSFRPCHYLMPLLLSRSFFSLPGAHFLCSPGTFFSFSSFFP